MLQRSRESSSGATTLPSISLHQMNQDAADSISWSSLCAVTWALSYHLVLFPWCALVGFAYNMDLLELEV